MAKRKMLTMASVITGLLAASLVMFFVFRHFNRQSMIRGTLEWGRLAPFPKTIQSFSIKTEGSMFTRAFRATFKAKADVIEKWLQDSPGIQGLTLERPQSNLRKYIIDPGGGAQYAEVVVGDNLNEVRIYVYWS